MGHILTHLNPSNARAALTGKAAPENNDDAGAMIVELMVYIAIVAILMMIIGPNLNAMREKGAVSTLHTDANKVATMIDADFSLKGGAMYDATDVKNSAESQDVKLNQDVSVKTEVLDAAGAVSTKGTGYRIYVTSAATPHYCAVYTNTPDDKFKKQLNTLGKNDCGDMPAPINPSK